MSGAVQTHLPGFDDLVFDAQAVFRTVLETLSRPGRIKSLPIDIGVPPGLMPATASICLCLADRDTPLWLDESLRVPEVESFLRFHTGCTITDDPQAAAFAIVSDLPDGAMIATFNSGSPEYPDRSTTLIVQTADLRGEHGARLTGPGIESEHHLHIAGATTSLWDAIALNNAQFPLGVDLLFVADNRLAGIPRSICVEG